MIDWRQAYAEAMGALKEARKARDAAIEERDTAEIVKQGVMEEMERVGAERDLLCQVNLELVLRSLR